MWTAANRLLKGNLPGCHRLIKRAAGSWIEAENPFPLPKRVAGRLVWAHPGLLTAQVTEPHVLRWITEALRPEDTFFDIGAHCGWMSVIAAKRTGRKGHVRAFEPSPVLARIVGYHARVNRLPQLEVIAKAVSDTDSDGVPFYLVNQGLSFRSSLTIGSDDTRHIQPAEKTEIRVTSITLDRYCSSHNLVPHLIKIDVEGAELLVLRGAEMTLARHRPRLIVGVHPHWLPRDQTAAQIFQLLGRHGYRIEDASVISFEGADFGDYLLTADSEKPPLSRPFVSQ